MKQNKFFSKSIEDPKKLAALFLFLLSFIGFIWELIAALSSTEKTTVVIKPAQIGSSQKPLGLNSAVFTEPVFGNYMPVNFSEAEIKQSMLDVEIVGILFDEKEKDSQVILRVGGGKDESYGVGDKLPGGTIIKHISPNGIVVLHNGVLESLNLPKNKLIFESPAKPLIKE